jgi:hypothetical protein
LKTATCKTVRASTPYPPVLEPGIEEIGWLFGALKVQGLTAELGNADLTDTQIRALRGFDFRFSTFGKTMPFFGNILPTLRNYNRIEQCTLSVTAPALASEPSLDHKATPL